MPNCCRCAVTVPGMGSATNVSSSNANHTNGAITAIQKCGKRINNHGLTLPHLPSRLMTRRGGFLCSSFSMTAGVSIITNCKLLCRIISSSIRSNPKSTGAHGFAAFRILQSSSGEYNGSNSDKLGLEWNCAV